MPEFVNGLPLHALLVHFVVVLIPAAAAGSVVIAVWPAARQRYGWLVVAVTAGVTVLVPFVTRSGEKLKRRIDPEDPLIKRHQELGDLMLRFALLLLVFVVALMVIHELRRRGRDFRFSKIVMIVVAVLTIGSAVTAGIHVYRTGEAGSRAVFPDVPNLPPR